MTRVEAHLAARKAAVKAKDTRYVVWDGPQEGPHGGYQVGTWEDLQTFFLACRVDAAYDSTGQEEPSSY
jgi:hypothetical protein